jgi:hypothetical protein
VFLHVCFPSLSVLNAFWLSRCDKLSFNDTLIININSKDISKGEMFVRGITASRLAQGLIWLLVGMGLFAEIVAIPQISVGLEQRYSEYNGDAGLIQSMLTGLVLLGQLGLVLVVLLLRRINSKQLLDAHSVKWVNALISSSLGLSIVFVALLIWLSLENTMPPGIGILLLVAVFGSLALALITQSLKGVLLGAIDAQDELAGVI